MNNYKGFHFLRKFCPQQLPLDKTGRKKKEENAGAAFNRKIGTLTWRSRAVFFFSLAVTHPKNNTTRLWRAVFRVQTIQMYEETIRSSCHFNKS